MSNSSNEALYDLAREFMEEFTGTLWERVIERDIAASDLEALKYHLSEAKKELAIQEENFLTSEDYDIALQLRDQMREDGIPT